MMKASEIGKRLHRPVVLVGMMGSGKTRLGRMLAKVLDLPFIDTDDVITHEVGTTIPQIFATQGEIAFRDYESAIIRRYLKDDNTIRVVSTGGGSAMRPENADIIFGNTLSIWARADIQVLLQRVGRNSNRPLLQNADPEKTLRDMAAIRYPVYQRARLVIDTGSQSPELVLEHTLRMIEESVS
jgi:shikimate kinase